MKLLVFLFSLLLYNCSDPFCDIRTALFLTYNNETNKNVNVVYSGDTVNTFTIPAGGLRKIDLFKDLPPYEWGNYPIRWEEQNKGSSVKLIFGDNEKCLLFSDSSSIDSLDITSEDSFIKTHEEFDCGGFESNSFYKITEYHYQQASDCN